MTATKVRVIGFGARLRTLRKARGISLRDLSRLAEVSKASISDMENEIKHPGIDILVALADALDVTTDELLGRTPAAEM